MKKRIIVYGLLAVVIAVTSYYAVIKEKMPTGRGTGMARNYGMGSEGLSHSNVIPPQLFNVQKGKITRITTADTYDYFNVKFVHEEGHSSHYLVYPDSKEVHLAFLAYQTQSKCVIGVVNGVIVSIDISQGSDQTTLMINRIEEINNTTKTIGNYARYIWYYVYNIYRRMR